MQNLLQVLTKNSTVYNDKYILKYIFFIEKCRKMSFTGYTEKHHVIPKSFGGTDDSTNIIKLSARHHYVAHLLLMRATKNKKMIKAVHRMVFGKNKNIKRDYKITSKMYSILRQHHSEIVSSYSKDTVLARQIYTKELKRIPKKLFDYYKDILYEGVRKNSKDSLQTRLRKSIGNKGKSRKTFIDKEKRSLSASKWGYSTPKGYCKNFRDLLILYPSFTGSTLDPIRDNKKITKKFASVHIEFKPHIGKTFSEYGIIRIERNKSD